MVGTEVNFCRDIPGRVNDGPGKRDLMGCTKKADTAGADRSQEMGQGLRNWVSVEVKIPGLLCLPKRCVRRGVTEKDHSGLMHQEDVTS